METVSIKMYRALQAAGAPTERAMQGAAVLSQLDKHIIKLKFRQTVTYWMLAVNLALNGIALSLILWQ